MTWMTTWAETSQSTYNFSLWLGAKSTTFCYSTGNINFWLHSMNKTGKDYGDVLSTMDLSLVLKTISTLQYQEWTQVHVASLTVLQLLIPHCVNVGPAVGSRPCRVRRVFTFLMAIMLAGARQFRGLASSLLPHWICIGPVYSVAHYSDTLTA